MNKERSYTLTMKVDKEGSITMESINDGMATFEILGLLSYNSYDIYKQLNGDIQPPEMIRRAVIQEAPNDSQQ